MLTREQLHAFLCMRKQNGTLFSALPRDLIHYMGQASIANFSEDSEIAKLLHHIAYGDLQSAKAMLEVNPRLVLQAGHVATPSGLKVLHTTPLECALGAGDPEMAKMIAPYFDSNKISCGAEVREIQYVRYRQHIEDMLNPEKNPPYDFTLLIETLIAAKSEDVMAALHRDTTHDSVFHDALEQFRKDFTPGSITSGMHFNYLHLLHAYDVHDRNYEKLYKSADNHYVKLSLFSRQIIGFIQRTLPAIDRMVFAQSLYDVVENKGEIKRSFKFRHHTINFPDAAGGLTLLSGLGFEYCAGPDGRFNGCIGAYGRDCVALKILMSSKKDELAELNPQREEKLFRCVIC